MITIAVDNDLTGAIIIRDLMCALDPEGTHYAADDPAECLTLLESAKPDIAWLDIRLNGADGRELAAEITKRSPETNIVFVTDHPEYAVDAFAMHASGFILKPATEQKLQEEIENLRKPLRSTSDWLLKVQCFGNFDVYSPEGRVNFSRSLAKEAFAYLIDRRGTGCTVSEICSVLWEDRQIDKSLKSQCRVIMSSLKKSLAEVGADEVLIKSWNIWGVDTSKVLCDYYEYIKGNKDVINLFGGEYMTQYSWAEMTTGNLTDIQ